MVAGWAYQWIAQLSLTQDSGTAPLDVRRVHPRESATAVAVAQIQALVARLTKAAAIPLFVFDAGYDPLHRAAALADTPAAIPVRLRRGRCFYGDPPPPTGRGHPRRHGQRFVRDDPQTCPTPTDERVELDEQYGAVRVRAWAGLHAIPGQGRTTPRPVRAPKPVVPGTRILVKVDRVLQKTRALQQLGLWWHGPGTPDLAVAWRAYVRRFDVEHTFRFAKQVLNWTTPRVRRAFSRVQAALGTPARPPKPCGRSPGRPKGRRSGTAPRYPALKKTA